MSAIPTLVTVVTLFALLFSISNPSRIIAIYVVTRPIIQPFIFLQQAFLTVPYSHIWAAILPLLFVAHFFRLGWTLMCYKILPLLLMLLLAVLSLLVTVHVGLTVDGIIKLAIAILAYSAAYNVVKNIETAEYILKAVVWSSLVPLLFGFYQTITGDYAQIHSSVTDRANSVFGVGNGYGIYLTISMCALLPLLLKKDLSKRDRLIYLTLMASMCASQVLALNRGTWIALSGAIVIALFPYRHKIKMRYFAMGALAIAVAFSGIIVKRLTETTYRWDGRKADTFGDRIDHWNSMIPDILESPLLGYGIGTTGMLEGTHTPHNDYFRFAMDIGIPGAVIYIYFVVSLAWFYLRRSKPSFRTDLWRFNFPMAVLAIYFVVISSTQNITQSFINFGFYLMLNGAIVKLNLLHPSALVTGNKGPQPELQKPKGLLVAHRERQKAQISR